MPRLACPRIIVLGIVLCPLVGHPVALARGAAGYVHEVRGKVQHRAAGSRTFGPLPTSLLVDDGDTLRLRPGVEAVVTFLGQAGTRITLKGPRDFTVKRPGGAPRPAVPGASVSLAQVLRLLLLRNESYHRQGAADLATPAAAGPVNLLSPRFSLVRDARDLVLRWEARPGVRQYQVRLWRYEQTGETVDTTAPVTCTTPACAWKVPAAQAPPPGVQAFWNVRAGTAPAYPATGVWFTVATPALRAALEAALRTARSGTASARALAEALVLAQQGAHDLALERLRAAGRTPETRELEARLLCLTCRAAAANQVAGRASYCTCREEPIR
jgi:hypothetical protein